MPCQPLCADRCQERLYADDIHNAREKTIAKLLTYPAAVHILDRQIDEVLLAEAAFRLRTRCHQLRQRHRDVSLRACQDLCAVEIATISDDIELISTKNLLCLRGDFG